MQSPENDTAARLRNVRAGLVGIKEQLATLVMHDDATGEDIAAPLVCGVWQPLASRPGVDLFPIPHPDGTPGLFAAFCRIAGGSAGADGSSDHSQLIALLAGDLACNGQAYAPGQSLYIPAHQPSTWQVRDGYLSAILFNAPPPNPATHPDDFINCPQP